MHMYVLLAMLELFCIQYFESTAYIQTDKQTNRTEYIISLLPTTGCW